MEIIKYNKKYFSIWNEFVDNSKNGTIFHKQQFLKYHTDNKFVDNSLLFMDNNKLISVFPAAVITKDNMDILKSHPGASYGGPVFQKEHGLKEIIDVIDALIDYGKNNSFGAIEMRLSERIFHSNLSEDIEYVLWYRNFKVLSVELSSAISFINETKESIKKKIRYNSLQPATKALKEGVSITQSEDYFSFWKILELNLARHGARPTHTLEEILRLCELFPENIKLFVAMYEGVIIAGTVVFVCNNKTCHTFYIAQDYNYQHLRSLNLLLLEVIMWVYNSGFNYLNFGISTEAAGTIVNPGLFKFKEGFGAGGTVRRYYKKDLFEDEQ